MKKLLLLAFITLVVIQWLVPGSMIWKRETILRKGTAYKFRTEPVDPYHPFKGKYVALRFTESQFETKNAGSYAYGQEIYLRLTKDDSGYAKIFSAHTEAPSGAEDFITASVGYINSAGDADSLATVHVKYPFDEFYMDEFKAPMAERVYRDSARANATGAYALVKVYRGGAVTENLFIHDKPIRELLQ